MKRYHALVSIGGAILFVLLPIGAFVVSSLRSETERDSRSRPTSPPVAPIPSAAAAPAGTGLDPQIEALGSRLTALEAVVAKLGEGQQLAAYTPNQRPGSFIPTPLKLRLSDPGLVLPAPASAPQHEFQALNRQVQELKQQIADLATSVARRAPTSPPALPAGGPESAPETKSTNRAEAPSSATAPTATAQSVTAQSVTAQSATAQSATAQSATEPSATAPPATASAPPNAAQRGAKPAPGRTRKTKDRGAKVPPNEVEDDAATVLSEKELARAARSKLRRDRGASGEKADPSAKAAAGSATPGGFSGDDFGEEEENQQFVPIEIGSPREGATVGRVEQFYAYTNVPGWPVILVSSNQDDDSWWAQPVVGRHAQQIGAKVHFGNDESFSGSSFRLVVLLLDSEEEAVRFRTARQFKEIPRGIKRSREFRFVLR